MFVNVWSLWLVLLSAIVSLVVAFLLKKKVSTADPGNEEMVKVQGYIRDGANAFVRRQYKTLAIFVVGLAIIVGIIYAVYPIGEGSNVKWWVMVLSFMVGSAASAWAGWLGMKVGVDANAKTAQAATKGLTPAFNVSFFGGAVMGLIVTSAALGGVWLLYYVVGEPIVILGFSFGASTIALFAKAGGGIFTKTADVAADLVGKIEYSLPEDDPRNPAAVADNVGDNVGDIAGMGADLFDSYVASIIGAMLLGYGVSRLDNFDDINGHILASFPLVISAAGLFASIVGIYVISKMKKTSPGKALNNGTYLAAALFIGIGALFTLFLTLSSGIETGGTGRFGNMVHKLWLNYGAAAFGVLAGIVIGLTTDYYTDDSKHPTQAVAESSQQGHALNILTGFSYGLLSVAPPTLGIVVVMGISYALDGVIGVASASTGMLAIVGTIVANDAYGPIVDNARGIAEQGGLEEDVIALCDKLDSAGNTAKAVTKGFSIGAAALTVLALLYSFIEEANVLLDDTTFDGDLNILNVDIMIGLLLGVMIPCIYSAVLIFAVDKNAQVMVKEIRRQFEEHPGIIEGTEPADFERCIDIATLGSLKALVVPSLLSVLAPIVVGVLFGVRALGAFLAGTILIGFIFGLLLSNAGGTWDNAKKYIEDGNLGGKGTLAHAASVTGDTVGDPFKDTAGPAINTLICVMSLTASMFLRLFVAINNGEGLIQLGTLLP
ncbi:sodium-translocating pyrophosphatase [Candidatus Lokiarchaeum ossiferum]|uniref:sodium-translocating pyrophosphatase n=1 Tax=Candidatus Lokiarchaeum ossiferum TaxID=2951803 RepID=UPI00352D2546